MGSTLQDIIAKQKEPIDQHAPGAKLDQGKTQASLLGMFARALLAVADVGTHGAAKYSRGGWQFVEDGVTRYDDAKWRHMLQGYIEPLDDDSGLEHIAQEAWNALAKLELHLREKQNG
jgi:hypothetical protein